MGSPAIGAGLDGADYGAPLVWSVAQRDVAIVEIGYAGIERSEPRMDQAAQRR